MDISAPVLAAIYNILKDATGALGKTVRFENATSSGAIRNHITEADLPSGRVCLLR